MASFLPPPPTPSPPRTPTDLDLGRACNPKAPPSRAVSLDPAALHSSHELLDEFDAEPTTANSAPASHRLPSHAFARAKTRSYTSPHLVAPRAAAGSPAGDPSSHHPRRKVTINAPAAAVEAQLEPIPVIPVDVFLGGSCNPTTWRRDVAVPMLREAGISYFNPQVDEWYEELVAEETRAKEGAKFLLIVIDNSTRAIVSINESVEYICRGRRLVLVVQNLAIGTKVDGVELTAAELADLNGARECLRRLAVKRGVAVCDDVTSAVDEIIACLDENPRAFAPEVPRLRKRSSIILNEWAGQFRPRRNTSRSWSSTSLLSVVSGSDDNDECEATSPDDGSPDHAIVKHMGTARGGSVYLGGNLQATSWREKVAVPRLQKAGIPFYIPYQDYLSRELQRLSTRQPVSMGERWLEMEMARDNAELILFVIPDRSRSIAAMAEAVELICNDHAMLLVLEPLSAECELDDGCRLIGREYKDLARARVYLQEMAERHDVEVFQSVQSALDTLIRRLE
ncbi:hypothetical protein P43SY_006349 [Pythium insidiosum]|uniref:Uncharacterized protein n=1 Tax=Pythium insidiosum TaxID=114742 RepID=A0AAD5M8A8_PYTIN|nr:hypothetical protein P43SY_006349 [Pythium insidiosum]